MLFSKIYRLSHVIRLIYSVILHSNFNFLPWFQKSNKIVTVLIKIHPFHRSFQSKSIFCQYKEYWIGLLLLLLLSNVTFSCMVPWGVNYILLLPQAPPVKPLHEANYLRPPSRTNSPPFPWHTNKHLFNKSDL